MVSVWNHFGDNPRATLAEPEFKAYRDRSSSFEAMAAYTPAERTLASLIPAIRAAGLDPLRVLQENRCDQRAVILLDQADGELGI